jgi:MFS family permease
MSTHLPPGLWLISLAAFTSMASMRVCDPMLVALSEEFQVSVGEASRVVSGFAIAYGCMQLFYGPLGDRLGKLRVINAALLVCGGFSVVTAMASDFDWLVGARALMGASAAAIIPLSMAWLGDQVGYERRQETLARLMSATVIGMMAGQWFGAGRAVWSGGRVAVSAHGRAAAYCCHAH